MVFVFEIYEAVNFGFTKVNVKIILAETGNYQTGPQEGKGIKIENVKHKRVDK